MKSVVFAFLTFAACGLAGAQSQTTSTQPRPSPQPIAPPPTSSEQMQRSGGSLLRAAMAASPDPNQAKLSNVSYFAVPDPVPRTIKQHDLVTIIVREVSESKTEGTTDLKKNADFQAALEEWIKLSIHNFEIQGGAQGPVPPSIKASGQRNFKGEATVDRTDSLILRVTAEVLDVKPNGTLVLQARQRVQTDEEEQVFILSGICRAEDVTADNTVLSTQMFDKDLVKTNKGAVRDTTKRGWIPRILDVLNPF